MGERVGRARQQPPLHGEGFGFTVERTLQDACPTHERAEAQVSVLGRVGTIATPHGLIQTPAFIPVGTKATVKGLLPREIRELGGQAVLANAYHLYLQPGSELVDQAGGIASFMNWHGPTFTDSGGFQVMSLGAGYQKVVEMHVQDDTNETPKLQPVKRHKESLTKITEEGVRFKSHIDGSYHQFTPEISMRVQHEIGADIMFAFDELTTLAHSRTYQEESVLRTERWAVRCLDEHYRQTQARAHRPYQALFGVVQGAQYEDLRRYAAKSLAALRGNEHPESQFDGFGIGGAIEKTRLGQIVSWVCEELPQEKPRHLLGISEPDDLFRAVQAGADTFDCVAPSRQARGGTMYSRAGRINLKNAKHRTRFEPLEPGCDCFTCENYDAAYLHHLFKSKEMLASTLATIHNVRFIIRLVADIRTSILEGTFYDFRDETLGNYYG